MSPRTLSPLALALILGCSPAEPITVSGKVVSLGLGGLGLAGAAVCFADDCVEADDEGDYALVDLPAHTEGTTRLTADSHIQARADMTTGEVDYPGFQVGLAAEMFWESVIADQDTPEEPGTGSVSLWTIDTQSTVEHERLEGFVISLEAQDAVGPLYDGEGTGPLGPGDSTGDDGLTVFYNVPPGTWDLTITKDGWTCAPHELVRQSDGAMQVTVEADWVTYFVAVCGPDA